MNRIHSADFRKNGKYVPIETNPKTLFVLTSTKSKSRKMIKTQPAWNDTQADKVPQYKTHQDQYT